MPQTPKEWAALAQARQEEIDRLLGVIYRQSEQHARELSMARKQGEVDGLKLALARIREEGS